MCGKRRGISCRRRSRTGHKFEQQDSIPEGSVIAYLTHPAHKWVLYAIGGKGILKGMLYREVKSDLWRGLKEACIIFGWGREREV